MQKTLFIALLLSIGATLMAQINTPVTWHFAQKHISGSEYELTFTAEIEDGWHLYSMNIDDGGPIKTTFTFEQNNKVKRLGEVSTESKEIRKHDEMFDMEIGYYEDKVIFKQIVKGESGQIVKGYIEHMSCNEETCTPPIEAEFNITLSTKKTSKQEKVKKQSSSPK